MGSFAILILGLLMWGLGSYVEHEPKTKPMKIEPPPLPPRSEDYFTPGRACQEAGANLWSGNNPSDLIAWEYFMAAAIGNIACGKLSYRPYKTTVERLSGIDRAGGTRESHDIRWIYKAILKAFGMTHSEFVIWLENRFVSDNTDVSKVRCIDGAFYRVICDKHMKEKSDWFPKLDTTKRITYYAVPLLPTAKVKRMCEQEEDGESISLDAIYVFSSARSVNEIMRKYRTDHILYGFIGENFPSHLAKYGFGKIPRPQSRHQAQNKRPDDFE